MTPAAEPPALQLAREAWRVTVKGVVQGVGFRPFVHRLAERHRLGGYVRNVAADVEVLIEGEPAALSAFVAALRDDAPPLASVRQVDVLPDVEAGRREFVVAASGDREIRQPLISPDVAPCTECERELTDTSSRRFGYPFTTCTDCGPRYSVIEDLPYDRERTSMLAFQQCPECEREYRDLGDRRYRSETNSCPRCGPSVALLDVHGGDMSSDNPIRAAAELLCAGAIVAVRGIGGFHLAADATSEAAVARLRHRKRREGKPLAIMVRHLGDARELAWVSDVESRLLSSPERPIVILERKRDAIVAPSVSEGLTTVGVMLPCSPLHMLLLDAAARPLVMTSGNPTTLPLATTLDTARAMLGDVADAFLTHDRTIAAPVDDSVARVVDEQTLMMRRARGFAPLPVPLPIAAPEPILAVGAHLKNTFTLAAGTEAFVSPHIGDLETLETVQHWEQSLSSLSRMLRIEPVVIARDLHPQYASSRLAERYGAGRIEVVQHHHAHIAAVAGEHGITERVLGVAFDGTGLGADGAIWGAELMVADLVTYRRVGQLRYAALPGGDRAAREGWRAAVGYAHDRGAAGETIVGALRGIHPAAMSLVRRQCAAGVNAPLASSMGRLFDAAAAITGVATSSRYEGEAAMRLEAAAGTREGEVIPLPVSREGAFSIDPFPILSQLAVRTLAGADPRDLAASFHETVAAGMAATILELGERERLDVTVLGGGSFQNARLLMGLRHRLERGGMRVLTNCGLPPNDGGISYGQAVIAAARAASSQQVGGQGFYE